MFRRKVSFILIFAMLIGCLTDFTEADAAARVGGDYAINVSSDQMLELQVLYGSKGVLSVNGDTLQVDEDYLYNYKEYAESTTAAAADPKKIAKTVFESDDPDILKVDLSGGAYEALDIGTTYLTVKGYNEYEDELFDKRCSVEIIPDLTEATLSKTSFTVYKISDSYDDVEVTVNIKDAKGLDKVDDLAWQLTCDISNSDMYVSASMENNKITLSTFSVGTTKVILTLYGKKFVVTLKIKEVKLKDGTSLLLVKGKTKQLTLKGYSGKLNWKSSNKKAVSVTAKGKIKAKRKGSAILKTKIGSSYVGCAVSVVTKGRMKVIKKAVWIGKHCQYSQPKRMQSAYYDCSSLVWKSYRCEGRYLLSRSYAPTAASIAQWCSSHHKIIKSSRKKLKNLKIQPGAVVFKTGENNGRFKGIYHIEMFIGYRVTGFSSNGKPYIVGRWANRVDGYGDYETYWAQF